MSWLYFQDQWSLNHKCSFDGINKLIIVGPNTNVLDIKVDCYSSWKEWYLLYDNSKYLPAVRSTGGDPIGGGQYTGDVYFMINGWRIIVDHSCSINGVIYSDDFPSPFVQVDGTQIVTNKVASLVTTVSTGGAGGGSTAAEIWTYNGRSLSTAPPTATQIRTEMDNNSSKLASIVGYTDTLETTINGLPTAVQIRTEIDNNSTKLASLEAGHVSILASINNVAIASAAIHAPAIAFQLVSGTQTGTYLDTRTIDVGEHVITDSALAFDINYTFDIGLNSVPAEITFIGQVLDQHEVINIGAWNYALGNWEKIGEINGSKAGAANGTTKFTLYPDNTSTMSGQIGDVKIRFWSTALSDIILHVDQLYVSYAVLQAVTGFSGHAVSATSTSIVLSSDASSVDNYYVPSLLTVNHGTGAQQYAKIIGYVGSTRTLQLELPMSTTLDATSHITLSPWANSTTTIDNAAIATAVRAELTPELTHVMQIPTSGSLTTQQANMLLSIYELMGLDPAKPLVVTKTSRTAGTIQQNISSTSDSTTVTRI